MLDDACAPWLQGVPPKPGSLAGRCRAGWAGEADGTRHAGLQPDPGKNRLWDGCVADTHCLLTAFPPSHCCQPCSKF